MSKDKSLTNPVSTCCNAAYYPSNPKPDKGSTVFYVCDKCGKACDVKEVTLKEKLLGSVFDSSCQFSQIKIFYQEVCKRAEEKMLTSHKLEGMHYAAMREIMKELGSDD